MNPQFSQLAVSMLIALPMLVVCLVGAALAITRWRRHPGVSLKTLAALALFALSLAIRVAYVPILQVFVRNEALLPYIRWVSIAINVAGMALNVCAISLLLLAVFARRPDKPPLAVNDAESKTDSPFRH